MGTAILQLVLTAKIVAVLFGKVLSVPRAALAAVASLTTVAMFDPGFFAWCVWTFGEWGACWNTSL